MFSQIQSKKHCTTPTKKSITTLKVIMDCMVVYCDAVGGSSDIRAYTLKRNTTMSPSWNTYSLPSMCILPASFTAASLP